MVMAGPGVGILRHGKSVYGLSLRLVPVLHAKFSQLRAFSSLATTFCPGLGDLGACAYIVERAPHPDGFTGRVRGYEMLTISEKPADLTQVFPYQKSHCAVNFTVRAVITPNGLSQFPVGL